MAGLITKFSKVGGIAAGALLALTLMAGCSANKDVEAAQAAATQADQSASRAAAASKQAQDAAAFPHAAEFQITFEDVSHGPCLILVDRQLPLAHVVSHREGPAHPDALAFGGGDLVADAFTDHFALELREGEQHVERQPPQRL
jgi:hypothetical protein